MVSSSRCQLEQFHKSRRHRSAFTVSQKYWSTSSPAIEAALRRTKAVFHIACIFAFGAASILFSLDSLTDQFSQRSNSITHTSTIAAKPWRSRIPCCRIIPCHCKAVIGIHSHRSIALGCLLYMSQKQQAKVNETSWTA